MEIKLSTLIKEFRSRKASHEKREFMAAAPVLGHEWYLNEQDFGPVPDL
jgi:hypothetical protein